MLGIEWLLSVATCLNTTEKIIEGEVSLMVHVCQQAAPAVSEHVLHVAKIECM